MEKRRELVPKPHRSCTPRLFSRDMSDSTPLSLISNPLLSELNLDRSSNGIQAYLIGLSSYLPEKILTNGELEQIVNTSDEWIKTRTGIAQRHIAQTDESTSDMAIIAAKSCLSSAGLAPCDVQLIIVATMTPDYPCPSTAGIVADALGCTRAGCFDLQAACSGFIYSLATAKAFVASGAFDHVMVICSEKMSSVIDYSDRNTCVLFGDGAVACLVTNSKGGWRLLKSDLGSDGSGAVHLRIPSGGAREPTSKTTFADRRHFLKMNGKEVYKQAIRRMQQVCKSCLIANGLELAQIDWLIFHQANARIIDALVEKLGIDRSKLVSNLERVGNTSAASIPLLLGEIELRVQKGEYALLSSFGAGFSWAAAILQRAEADDPKI